MSTNVAAGTPSLSLRGVARLCLVVAIVDGLFTSGLIAVPLGGVHVLGYRLFLAASVLFLITRAIAEPSAARWKIRVRRYVGFFVGWCAFALLTLAWVLSAPLAWRQIGFLAEGTLFIILSVITLNTPRKLERVVWLWLAIFAMAGVVGLWESATGSHLAGSGLLGADERVADEFANMPTAWYRNANNFAFFLVMSAALALGCLRHRARGWRWLALQLAFAIGLGALVFTRARLAYIAAVMSWLAWALLPWLVGRRRAPRLRPGHVALTLLLVGVLIATPAGRMIAEQAASLSETIGGQLQNDPRVQLAQEIVDVVRKTSGRGAGAGNIEVYLEQYPFSYEAGLTNPHGWWMEIAGDYGIAGVVAYTAFYLALLWNVWRAYRRQYRRGERPMLLEGALVGLIAFPAASFGPSSIAGFATHWIFLAFCLAVLNTYRLGREAESREVTHA